VPTDAEILKVAKDRFALAAGADKSQRQRELEVLEFDAGNQWTDEMKSPRAAGMVNGVAVPGRPMLTIPKTTQPVKLVVNQMQRAHLGVQVHAESEDASDDTAEILQGLYRHIEQQSRAHIGRGWAFKHKTKMGRGYYRVNKRTAKHGGLEFGDQELTIERILNQHSVYLDPFAQQPDWSDGEWAFITVWMPWDRYKREFPTSDLVKRVTNDGSNDEEWEGVGDDAPDWFTDTDAGKSIRVSEYFYVETKVYTRCAYSNGLMGWKKEAPEDAEDQTIVPDDIDKKLLIREWPVEQRKVFWSKLNGLEVLEKPIEWDGCYIPIMVDIGDEKHINGRRKYEGMIEPAMDACRMFNVAASGMVEKNALVTKAPYVMAEGQEEGHEEEFALANVKNLPYLRYKAKELGGKLIPPPERNFGSVDITPELAMIEQSDQFIKSITAVHDPSLGDDKKSRTGKAVLALQQQAEQSNSDYLDNFASITLTYEAMVILDLIPKVYDRPGRITEILGENDDRKRVMLNAPFTVDPNTKRPMPAQPGMQGQGVKQYDLKQGRYGVVVSVGKSYANKMQQGADEVGQTLQAVPQLMSIIGDIYFKYRDFPGAKEIADRIKKMLPPQLQEEGEGGQPSPEQMQQQLAQATQAYQQLQQAAQGMAEELKTDKAKQEAQVIVARERGAVERDIAQMKIQAELEIARIKAQAQIATEQIKAQLDQARAAFDAEIQDEQNAAAAQENERGRQHEAGMAQHEAGMAEREAARDRMHEAGMGERDKGHEREMAEVGHAQALEQTTVAADREDARAQMEREDDGA
jgi:hypothetical protein